MSSNVEFSCNVCGKRTTLTADTFARVAGRKTRCVHCGAAISLPQNARMQSPSAPPTSATTAGNPFASVADMADNFPQSGSRRPAAPQLQIPAFIVPLLVAAIFLVLCFVLMRLLGISLSGNTAVSLIAVIVVLIIGAVITVIHFLPSIIAFRRGHHFKWPLFATNVVLGWTILGYWFCMFWAVWPEGTAMFAMFTDVKFRTGTGSP